MATTRYQQRYLTADRANRAQWTGWLKAYGAERFFAAFLRNAQGAESVCVHCRQPIYLDIVVGGGVPDWGTADGDFGCARSPETTDEGVGSHFPRRSTK